MKREWIDYQWKGKTFKAYLAYNETAAKKLPAVLIAHAWKGQDDFARTKADQLAEQGYAGFAADLYGDGKSVETNAEAEALMVPLFQDRKELRERACAAYDALIKHPAVDPSHIASLGFCFGGLTVLELLRSGAALKGSVCVHGLLGDAIGEMKARRQPSANKLYGALLILHGYKDPLVSKEDIEQRQREFSEAGIDWQMHIYGNASHAFTNPLADEPQLGLIYHRKTEQRALLTIKNFLKELFEKGAPE